MQSHARIVRTSNLELQPGLQLDQLQAPIAVCDATGLVLTSTAQAQDLLRRMTDVDEAPARLPRDLWDELKKVPAGEAVDWRPPGNATNVFGCTRYAYRDEFIVLMKEVSHKHAALSKRLHSQRLEATGRLVASVAHELRNAVASIVYSAELLDMTGLELSPDALRETLHEMVCASRQLRSSVDSLLGYARLGPSAYIPVSLRDVMTRAQGFLRSVYREGTRKMVVDITPSAEWVQGNTLAIEQIFVNLLLNAAEASTGALTVRVESDLAMLPGAAPDAPAYVRVRVSDDGPGIPARVRESVFQPFFSTREHGTGLGLTIASEAAHSLGGALMLEDQNVGASFAVYLPRRLQPREELNE